MKENIWLKKGEREKERERKRESEALTYFTWPLEFTTATINCMRQGEHMPVNMGIFVSNEAKATRFIGERINF